MIILRKLRGFVSLGSERRRLLVEALLLTTFIPAGFRFLGVARTQTCLRRWASLRRNHPPPANFQSAIRNALLAQSILKRNWRTEQTCLSRSFLLWAMLLRRGVDTNLRVGFRKRDETLEGHAWVEHNGVPLNEDPSVVRTYWVSGEPTSFDFEAAKKPVVRNT